MAFAENPNYQDKIYYAISSAYRMAFPNGECNKDKVQFCWDISFGLTNWKKPYKVL